LQAVFVNAANVVYDIVVFGVIVGVFVLRISMSMVLIRD
jgi:hypothetical protein